MKNQNRFSFSKILFIFSLLFVFSLTQVNFSGAQVRDLTCYVLAGKIVDINGSKILDNDLPRCKEPQLPFTGTPSGTPQAAAQAITNVNNRDPDEVAAEQAANLEASKKADTEGKNFCIDTTPLAKKAACYIVYSFMEVALQIAAVFAKLSSTMFDILSQKFVLQISTLFKTEAVVNGVTTLIDKPYVYGAWSVIRDLANIAAFFGAIYTGFRYIIGSDGLDFKKAVTKLILYSILVNFSFPIAKFLIDVSNVISLQIYGGITDYKIGSGNLSNMILSRMGAVSMLVSDVGSASTKFSGFSSFSVMFLAIVYLFTIFFVFIYAALMIAVRSFILFACVILSPLMFLNFAFPKLTELHEKWRENFFGQLIFAPVLMFGFWLSFILMSAATTGTDSLAGLSGTTSDLSSGKEITDIINMTLAIIALFMTVKIAGSVSGGAGKSISGMVGGGMKGLGLAVATGGAGLAFRGTVGRAGAAMANSQWVAKNKGSENGATRRLTASLLGGAGTKMSNFKLAGTKSFDEKKAGNVAADKAKMKEENSQQIRKTGMSDLIAQAKNPEELKLAKEEMDKISSDPNYKRNNDLFGRNAKQKAFELSQSDIKSAKDNNVTFLNQGEYKSELVNKKRLESGAVSKLRDERLKKAEEGRDRNLKDAKTQEEMYKALFKKDDSEKKAFDTGAEREEKIVPDLIAKSENKIESLKNTSLSDALRGKKTFTGAAPEIGSKLTEPIKI